MSRVLTKPSTLPPQTKSGGDPLPERCASGSSIALQIHCPDCGALVSLTISTPTPANTNSPMKLPAQPPPLSTHTPGPADFTLRRESVCWVLVFKGGNAYLKHEIGLAYSAWLLGHPDEEIASSSLFAKFSASTRKSTTGLELPDPETGEFKPVTDGVGVPVSPIKQEEDEARRQHEALLREYRKAMNDPANTKSERAEARRAYGELRAFLNQHYRSAPDPGRAVTKLVHKSIQRLCDRLREPMPGQKAADPVAVAFADYIEAHILVPSRRYTYAKPGARVRVARGEMAGRLIFECPQHDRWTVRF